MCSFESQDSATQIIHPWPTTGLMTKRRCWAQLSTNEHRWNTCIHFHCGPVCLLKIQKSRPGIPCSHISIVKFLPATLCICIETSWWNGWMYRGNIAGVSSPRRGTQRNDIIQVTRGVFEQVLRGIHTFLRSWSRKPEKGYQDSTSSRSYLFAIFPIITCVTSIDTKSPSVTQTRSKRRVSTSNV